MVGAWIAELVADGPTTKRDVGGYRLVMVLVILAATAIALLDTVHDLWGTWRREVDAAEDGALTLMAIDYGIRLYRALRAGRADGDGLAAVRRYALSVYGVFDFIVVIPFLIGSAIGLPADARTILGVLRLVKLARYSPALETLGAVVRAEARPLLSALFIVVLLVILTSTVLYFVERDAQSSFASVPAAMWWSVVTITSVGYGDVVPMTPLGKVLGGSVAVLGLCVFALPASILASGFAEEMRRQNFVSTWHLVAKVPFFSHLPANQIAEVASLLKPVRVTRNEIVVREGDVGDSMYFIVSGHVTVNTGGGAVSLKPGAFFGEIALLEQIPRTATVRAATRCQLLTLDTRDFHRFARAYPNLLDQMRCTARDRLAQVTMAHAS